MSSEGDCPRPKKPYYRVVDGFRIPGFFTEENYRSGLAYKPKPNDLFIATYPKCGTTWVQNIVTCILNGGDTFTSGMDFMTRTPFLEITGAEAVENMKRPGIIKVHLPFHLTPWSSEAKYIYVARNPKDACLSFYHHTENLPGYRFENGSFDDYFELFIDGEVDFGDYFDNLLPWYEHRNDPNVFFITYEELKKNTRANVLKMAEFIDKKYKDDLESNEQYLQKVLHHSSFKFMKEHLTEKFSKMKSPENESKLSINLIFKSDPSQNQFFRKGIVGDWKNVFTPMQNARLMKKYRERTRGTDIPDLWKDYM